MFRTILFLILILSASAAHSQGTDGFQVFKYPNGSVSGEGVIKNGKPEGYWKSYYVTGVKQSEGKYTAHMLDSIWVFYDNAGDTVLKINYLYGKKNGYYYKYKKDASEGLYIFSRELFAGDIKEGIAYIYYPDGKVKQTISYNRGKKEGLSKEYDSYGTVISLLEYNNDFLVSRDKINRTDNNGLKQGVWKDFYPSGGIKTERSFKDDLLHGYYKEYDLKGNLTVTMLYENGAIVKSNVEDQPDIEIVNRYDQNNRLIFSGPFRNQIPVGIHREFGQDGRVINARVYNDNGLLISEGIVDEAGNRNGKWKDFYADGKIQAEGQYTDNRRSGSWKFYDTGGRVEQTGSYNNGRPDGLWKWYYENGTLLREEDYFQGQRDGSLTEYSRSGEIIAQGQYADGERNGDWKISSGNNLEEGKFIVGLKDGQWKSFYNSGKLRFRGDFFQGNPDGAQFYYFESGKLREERYYSMGLRQKTWKKYDEEGNVLLTVTYKDDTEISVNGVKLNLPESDVKLIK